MTLLVAVGTRRLGHVLQWLEPGLLALLMPMARECGRLDS